MGLRKIFGGKKKAHTPVEAKESGRSQQFVRIVEVISEGEIEGLVAGERSIFLDNTPLKNADGSANFQNVGFDDRQGTQDQTAMTGFDSNEKEISVGTEVRKRTPLTRTVTDPNVTRLRLTLGVSSLFEQAENGDTNGSQVDFVIRIGSQTHNLRINGKYSSQYLRSLIIDNLPPVPFQIRVERVQADSTSQRLQNKTLWASYTEIIDTQFAYPNTALMGIKFDSEYFSQIPTRSYEMRGIKVQVPSNYDPATRTYNGVWNGTFKRAYSNNPAWVLMDIVTNARYGLGKRLGDFGVDKWALYQVAQYCDQLIPDGFGGTEPRFTCNVWLTEQRSAYDVINDICSIFRAMPVWNGTELTVIMDRPSDPVWTYTNANVIDGAFSREYSAVKARHNAIQVEYQDASNNYEKAVEYLSDDVAIRKYGLNLKKVVAFGCTSRGQAYRTGRWILETERLETETITFSVGAEGLMHAPGDIIQVSDNHYAGTAIGGRVVAISGRNVTLDREIQLNGNSVLSFINAEAKHSHIRIQSVRGKVVTLASQPTGLQENSVWSLSTQSVKSRLYRAMTIAENDDGSYTITALQHEPQKEAIVDNGASFEPIASTLHRTPKIEHLDVDLSSGKATFNWQSTTGEGTVTYDVRVLKGDKLYATHKGLTRLELALDDLPNGDYAVIVIGKNAMGQILSEKRKTFRVDRPPLPRNVRALGGLSDVAISWEYVDEFTQTEIWASETNNIRTARRVAKVLASFYSHSVGARQTRYYWLRHTRGQNVGNFHQQQGLRAETGVDIDEEMRLLNEKLSEPIINKVFDVAAPARGLELVKTVASLPNRRAYQNANLVFNSADKKLYTWTGTEYTLKVAVENLEGQIPTSKLTGQLQDAQIQSISSGKLVGNIPKTQLDPTLMADVNRLQETVSSRLGLADTRNDNRPPSWYWQHRPQQTVNEFKSAQAIGLNKAGFCTLQTVVAWRDPTGNPITQMAIDQDGVVHRRRSDVAFTGRGANPTYSRDTWTAWVADETALGAQAKADAVKRIADQAKRAASQASAAIETEREARTTALDAMSRKTDTLTSQIDNVNATVIQQSQTLAGLDGTVQSLHTISTQTISGNRKAIAGISLGSAGGTTSNIILMADRTQFVKNAQDGNPKTLMTVADGKLALNGDLLANGTVQAKHLDSNSVTTGAIEAGAVRADHLAAGQISADKLAIGLGGNLLTNPIFANPDANNLPYGYNKWQSGAARNMRIFCERGNGIWDMKSYLPNEHLLKFAVDGNASVSATISGTETPVIEGQYYMLSCYMGGHRCKVKLTARCHKADGSYTDFSSGFSTRSFTGGLKGAERLFIKFQAPAGTVSVSPIFWLFGTDNQNYKLAYVARPMLEECTEHTQEPSAWQNAGVTSIHGGSIVTNSITADQIAAGAITTKHMTAGEIDGKVLRAGTVTATQLSVQTLSAISSNIGTVTAGTIRGTQISGNTISGGTINGTAITGATISGGTITGVHISGVTGKFTGELEVTKLIGSAAMEQVMLTLTNYETKTEFRDEEYEVTRNGESETRYRKRPYSFYEYKGTIEFKSSPVKRYISIEGQASFILNPNTTKRVNVVRTRNEKEDVLLLVTAYALTENSKTIRLV